MTMTWHWRRPVPDAENTGDYTMTKYQESFPVLSIDREDIDHAIGYALGPELDEDQMRTIADKFSDALQALEPWNILADVVESFYYGEDRGLPENYQYEILDHDMKESE